MNSGVRSALVCSRRPRRSEARIARPAAGGPRGARAAAAGGCAPPPGGRRDRRGSGRRSPPRAGRGWWRRSRARRPAGTCCCPRGGSPGVSSTRSSLGWSSRAARRSRRGRWCRRGPARRRPTRRLSGAGEGALLVAEQLALQQVGGDGAAVDHHEGPSRRALARWMASAACSCRCPSRPRAAPWRRSAAARSSSAKHRAHGHRGAHQRAEAGVLGELEPVALRVKSKRSTTVPAEQAASAQEPSTTWTPSTMTPLGLFEVLHLRAAGSIAHLAVEARHGGVIHREIIERVRANGAHVRSGLPDGASAGALHNRETEAAHGGQTLRAARVLVGEGLVEVASLGAVRGFLAREDLGPVWRGHVLKLTSFVAVARPWPPAIRRLHADPPPQSEQHRSLYSVELGLTAVERAFRAHGRARP